MYKHKETGRINMNRKMKKGIRLIGKASREVRLAIDSARHVGVFFTFFNGTIPILQKKT